METEETFGGFAAAVAHEINNPLAAIIGFCEALRRSLARGEFDPADVGRQLIKIESIAMRISTIVADLKTLSSNRPSAVSERTVLAEAVREGQSSVAARYQKARTALRISDIPSALIVSAHAGLLAQAVVALLDNALEAVSGLSERWTQVDWEQDGSNVFVYVTDSGPGVPACDRARIFEPFYTTKKNQVGTGLGLSIAASAIARQGGELSLDHLSSGARFVIRLSLPTAVAEAA